jgi:hypothetical protein
MAGTLTRKQAQTLAQQLDLDLDGVCHACLCVVSFALEGGRPNEIAGALRGMTPDLWHDGLSEQALAAVGHVADAGVPHAREALADLEQHGGRSTVAQEIVRTLAAELSERSRTLRARAELS